MAARHTQNRNTERQTGLRHSAKVQQGVGHHQLKLSEDTNLTKEERARLPGVLAELLPSSRAGFALHKDHPQHEAYSNMLHTLRTEGLVDIGFNVGSWCLSVAGHDALVIGTTICILGYVALSIPDVPLDDMTILELLEKFAPGGIRLQCGYETAESQGPELHRRR